MKTRLLYSKIDSKILFSQPEGNQDNRIEKKKRKTIRTFFSPASHWCSCYSLPQVLLAQYYGDYHQHLILFSV